MEEHRFQKAEESGAVVASVEEALETEECISEIGIFFTKNEWNKKKIDPGAFDFSLKCLNGTYEDNFFYINLSEKGEILGSGDPNVEITVSSLFI